MLKLRKWQLCSIAFFLFFCRVKLKLFARDRESGNDMDASKIVKMINDGEAEGLEQYGFKVESATQSKYFFFFLFVRLLVCLFGFFF